MDTLKSFFSKNTKRGRAVRTAIQSVLAIFTFVIFMLAMPGLAEALQEGGIGVQAGTLAAWHGVVSYLYNALESLLEWLGNE